jgi:glucosamine--fructose-6-phosphate aminotransferase (isomerizing)
MCGIIGYIGHRESATTILQGLQDLEYRGYDSAGMAVLNGKMQVYKKAGKVNALAAAICNQQIHSHMGIGHTRWATHGVPNDINAHPQLSKSGKLAIVHNGIIENYYPLKQRLLSKGYTFQSETDTEVLINLIEDIQVSTACTLPEAVRSALLQVDGAYAVLIISEDLPHTLIAAKRGSPIAVGMGASEFFIVSDPHAIVTYTDQVCYLQDDAMVTIQDGEMMLQNMKSGPVKPQFQQLALGSYVVGKGEYEHFMLKEIFEQPKAIATCMRGRLDASKLGINLPSITQYASQLMNAPQITIIACGTSLLAGMVAKYIFEEFCRIPVQVEDASEFRYRAPIIQRGDIILAISQSGETADTLSATQLAQEHGALVLGICNVISSSLARVTQAGIYTHAGPEIGVASTKAFTTQLTALVLLALYIAQGRNTISEATFSKLVEALAKLPEQLQEVLQSTDRCKHIALAFQEATSFLYLGRGVNYPVALEGALKLKELSYIHAEGYPAGEMKHGPIALIDHNMPVVCIATEGQHYHKMLTNIQEVKARKGKIIAIVTEGDQQVSSLADHTIAIPATQEAFVPLLAVLPLQLLAYHMALAKGCDVDQPRNLAKSVTVE